MNFATLQHSAFLQALGSAILNSLWQVFIVWLIYETINAAYRTASAKFKNNLSTVLLFFAFAWFLTNFISKLFNAEKLIPANSSNVDNVVANTVHNTSAIQTVLSYAINSLPYLSVAYIFLLFFLMAKLLAAYRYVYFIANKRLIAPPFELQSFASKVASQMRITKKIGVWISHHIDVPATIGFIKPVILIPVASVNNLSASQLEAIILHELSHIKRNDYLINIIISVIETILFFNPFILLLSKVIKRERENCCDDFVLQYRYDPHSYASALLCLEQSRKNNLQLAIGAVSGKKQLLSRIKRITDCHVVSKQFNYGQKLLALLLVTGIICSVAWLSPEKKPIRTIVAKEKTHTYTNSQHIDKTISIAYKKSGNSGTTNLKIHSPKSQQFTLADNSMEDIPAESFNSLKNEKEDDQNLLSAKDEKEFKVFANYKHPAFKFDAASIKLPSVISIPNFPFQNMGINIELSKIDVEKLNENLQKAYKEINALDWGKIQGNLYENLRKWNSEDFLPKNSTGYFKENALAVLAQLKTLKNQQQSDAREFSKLRDRVFLRDSLRKKEFALVDETNQKVQQLYKTWQDQATENTSKNYYFIQGNNNTDAANTYNDTECPKKLREINSKRKNLKIIISQAPHSSHNLKEKKSFQYFFNETSETSNPENVVSVQLSETD
jgi:beta-lactamase regulating signal transducer with metallopeptidase domain